MEKVGPVVDAIIIIAFWMVVQSSMMGGRMPVMLLQLIVPK